MGHLSAIVLGSAAGGGFPQWNCFCAVCKLAWTGDKRVKPRTQASLAVSADQQNWILLNASPDLRAQLQASPSLHPRKAPRESPIAAVVLTGAEIDQTAGLLNLRERQAFTIYATSDTLAALSANPMFNVLAFDVVTRTAITSGNNFKLPGGIDAEAFSVPGKVPLYLEGNAPDLAREDGANVGIELIANGRRLIFVPGATAMTPALSARLARADVIFFDGTLFTDNEMIASGTGTKTGRRMGHMPIDGHDGSLALLQTIRAQKIYIHINNTNPILVDGSPERRKVETAGWQVGEDGLKVEL